MDMESFFTKSCTCSLGVIVTEKSFCYLESSQLDKSQADDPPELRTNVWFGCKPPKSLAKEISPRVTARQVQIARIQIEGRKMPETVAAEVKKQPSATQVSYGKKKQAVKFLSSTEIESSEEE